MVEEEKYFCNFFIAIFFFFFCLPFLLPKPTLAATSPSPLNTKSTVSPTLKPHPNPLLKGEGIKRKLPPTPTTDPKLPLPNLHPGFNLLNALAGASSLVLTLNNPVHLDDPKSSFSRADTPHFLLSIPEKQKNRIGIKREDIWNSGNEQISVALENEDNKQIPVTITKVSEGQFLLTPENPTDITPGSYHLAVAGKESAINRIILLSP